MKEGWEKGRKEAHGNAGCKEPEPLDVSHKVPVGCTPAKRAGQEIPDWRILQQEKTGRSTRQLPDWGAGQLFFSDHHQTAERSAF